MFVLQASRGSRLAARTLPSRQRGQALAFASITAVIVMLAMLVMVSSGQLTTEKMRLQNTGDAAAYSGALVLSRDYNFSAYTNRAMVANQVAIAQFVGLTSWARHNKQVFTRTGFSLVPCVYAIIGTPTEDSIMCIQRWNAMGAKAKSYSGEVESIAGASIGALDDLMGVISRAQQAYHMASLVTVPDTIAEVIKANDPDAALSTSITNAKFLLAFGKQFSAFSRQYGVNNTDELKRFADVTHRSLDVFSGLNGSVQRISLVPNPTMFVAGEPRTWEIPYLGGTMSLIGTHTGGTELTKDFKSWNAADVSSLNGWGMWYAGCAHWYTLGLPTCWSDFFGLYTPLGWDGAHTGPHGVTSGSFMGDNYLHEGSTTLGGTDSYGYAGYEHLPETILLTSGLYPEGSVGHFSGLQPYQELSNIDSSVNQRKLNTDSTQLASNVPVVVIEVEKKAATILTTTNMSGSANGDVKIGAGTVAMRLKDAPKSGVMRVVAGAEVYFARPEARSDGKVEWPSLFNPFWQARLRDTRADAALSAAAQ